MPRAPRIAGEAALRALLRAGWVESRRAGSHVILHGPCDRPGRVTVPVHAGRILKQGTLASILRQAGLTMEEFRDLL
jgi:predicted RNA binding protein YcfA (HicA-like mRNA interferase family)